ncbi:MAG: DUF2330 domain-containing protein [Acidimicrobiales bacterium]
MLKRTSRLAFAALAAGSTFVGLAGPAAACGGLIGENGSIELVRTTTLAGWHHGVEHYITSFEFSGSGESVGSIIPLPGVPDDVVGGSNWTLQRLLQEVQPARTTVALAEDAATAQAAGVDILLETQVDALDITVLSGGADDVGEWALDNGFFLTPDAPEVLEFYAARSPVFLAARFDAGRAAEQGLASGDATPIHVTIPLAQPWIPLRILGLGLPADERVEADLFLLTDDAPELLTGGDGLELERRERGSDLLLDDLRSDEGMEWVSDEMWLTHLVLDERAVDLDYDLSAGTAEQEPSARDAGLAFAGFDRTAFATDPANRGGGIDAGRVLAVVGFASGLGFLAAGAFAQLVAARRS